MNNDKKQLDTLLLFTQRYIKLWHTNMNHDPKSEELYGIASPCITKTEDLAVFWLPVQTNQHNLDIVEEVIDLTINPAAHLFYGSQYAGDMKAQLNDLSICLLQVWSDDDFSQLEQNIINHLLMQKKLKRRPSIFIATTDDETSIISIDNQTGKIILEKLVTNEIEVLADDIDSFIDSLKPIAQ